MTGGDSCYFAFISDFGEQKDLENAPIAFISPTDFDKNRPKQSNFLIANNIKEFLSLMVELEYAEHIRSEDIYDPAINNILEDRILEFQSDQDSEEIEIKKSTANKLISEFNLPAISNFYNHFKLVNKQRNTPNHLTTMEGLNIEYKSADLPIAVNGKTISEYHENLKNTNDASKLVAIRNAPYKFSFSDEEYDKYKTLLIDTFKELNLNRELKIQNFEIEMNKISSEWMEIRKQIINEER